MTLDLCRPGTLDRFPDHLELETFFNAVRPLYQLLETQQPALPCWRGDSLQQWPLDLLLYQEVVWATRPRTVVELGTGAGRTTRYWLDALRGAWLSFADYEGAQVITVELSDHWGARTPRPGITHLLGDSRDPAVYGHVRAAAKAPVMVTLDTEHDRQQVLDELRLWAPLVSPGQYLVVQDTWLGVWQGTWEGMALGGVKAFMEENHDFVIDLHPQRWLLTQCPFGWLRRK